MEHRIAFDNKPMTPIDASNHYRRINYANIDLNNWYYLTSEGKDFIAKVFIRTDYVTTFMAVQERKRDPLGDWTECGITFSVSTTGDIDLDTSLLKVYMFHP
jgi:hypothetical protein